MMRTKTAARIAALGVTLLGASAQAETFDTVPRTLVMTAYTPEWDALVHDVAGPVEYKFNGMTYLTCTLSGKPVVLMQSGVSMVNAAMNTQVALDHFNVKRIVFSGIAGGVDPALRQGDVVVAQDWAQYLEVSFARKTPKGWQPPEPVDAMAPPNWNFMFPRGVRVGNGAQPSRRHYTLPVDPALLDQARKLAATLSVDRCVPVPNGPAMCLARAPRVVVGGTGVSAGVFADNAQFRIYLHKAWKARVLDMESAAVVQVAYANRVPAIVFRSLSDLAGGGHGANTEEVFAHLASINSARVVTAFVAGLPD